MTTARRFGDPLINDSIQNGAARPLLLGHRGHRLGLLSRRGRHAMPLDMADADALAEIENTLPAFDRALRAGCDGLELDIHISHDRQLVITHDPVVGGRVVAESTLRELRQIQPSLPVLAVVLRRYRRKAWLDLEIKALGLERELLGILRQYPPERGYVVSSFLPQALICLGQLDPTISLCLNLARPRTPRVIRRIPVTYVAPDARFASRWYVTQLHRAGWKTLIWTVNRPRKMRMLQRCGVAAIVSDNPQLLVETIAPPNCRPVDE
jgi:glycerophosphoryl diester phosphodiesterase